ncbi:MAG: STAS domain-containing protein [Candidatus Obscuribacterales bacterium]|nr:STAS domain-containing protein [Candidatus Obscuribacterales bacterium]
MAVPILKQGSLLIATMQEALTDHAWLEFQTELVRSVGIHRARAVILDVTVLDVLDSFATRSLRNLAEMVKLRGARAIVVGIHPDVAFTMVQLGLTLEGIETAIDLEDALENLGTQGKFLHNAT